jgi:DNA invertase Pin-like site-specific DNA recombinase
MCTQGDIAEQTVCMSHMHVSRGDPGQSSQVQFATEIRAERQAEGIAAAKRRGVPFGHKPHLTPVQVAQLRQACQEGLGICQLMQRSGRSKASVYRSLAQDQAEMDAKAADAPCSPTLEPMAYFTSERV